MRKKEESGDEYESDLTRSWVTELFQGLKNTYKEYKGIEEGSEGYQEYYGQDIIDLFDSYASSDSSFTFQLKHVGAEEHEWVVEQLVGGGGYRVYHSYDQAYSLKSWLQEDDSDFEDLYDSGDFMIFEDLQAQVNAILAFMTMGGEQASLDNLDQFFVEYPEYSDAEDVLVFIRDYGYDEIISYFTPAWESWGKG
mmetsp:Transcript_25877/g.19514  ORF Transcript_25877/g.19514 Transcript_25877/m.19514 type:complete len:195 (-) Transcript_25877:329-913(-)